MDLAAAQAEMKSRASGGLSPAGKCEHGVYKPAGDKKALYCRLCTPEGPDAVRASVSDKPRKPRKAKAKPADNELESLSGDILETLLVQVPSGRPPVRKPHGHRTMGSEIIRDGSCQQESDATHNTY